MNKNIWIYIVNAISIVLSIIAICIAAYRTPCLGFDYIGVIVGILALLTTILIGWQIYNFIYLRSEIEKQMKEVANEYIDQFYHVIKGYITARSSNAYHVKHDVRTCYNCFFALEEVLKGKNADIKNTVLNAVMKEIKNAMISLKSEDGNFVIWEGKRNYYLHILSKIEHEDRDEIIEWVKSAKEVKSGW